MNEIFFICVWLNEFTLMWQTDGCELVPLTMNTAIHCYCEHLTIFSVISDYEQGDNSADERKELKFFTDKKLKVLHSFFLAIFSLIFVLILQNLFDTELFRIIEPSFILKPANNAKATGFRFCFHQVALYVFIFVQKCKKYS